MPKSPADMPPKNDGIKTARRRTLNWSMSRSRLSTESLEFLPAALAVQAKPPSPAARWLTWLLLSLFTIGILWTYFGRVDIVVSAPGRIIPSGHVKVVQAPEAGVITTIPVREGQYVQEGDVVIELDTTFASADDERLQQSIADNQMHQSWRHALDAWLVRFSSTDHLIGATPSDYRALSPVANSLLLHHQSEVQSRLQQFVEEIAALTAEHRGSLAETHKTIAVLDVLNERVLMFESLLDKQYTSKAQYLEIKQQQVDLERSIPLLKERKQKLEKQLLGLEAQRTSVLAEYKKNNLLELTLLESEHRAASQDLLKAQRRHLQHKLKAPVSGNIQQLQVHTVGGVVTASQELMKIIPNEAVVEVQALVRNKDIGFLVEGQQASVKIDTFNFTKYGYINAEVVDISEDVLEDADLGWVFQLKLALHEDHIQVGERTVKLTPGMSVVSEIKTGQRRIIEFFLSPLLRYKQEGIRER